MATKQVEMIVATTDVVPKYGGQWRLHEQALRSLAEQFRNLDRPMHIEHDARYTMATRVVDAKVRQRPDGEWELWAVLEADETEWARAGARTGLSIAVWVPVAQTQHNPDLPDIRLAVEPPAFGNDAEELLQTAVRPLEGKANVSVHALFQFNVDTDVVKIVIEIALFAFLSIANGTIYDVAKSFWPMGKSRTNHFEFVLDRTHSPDGDRDTVKMIVETDDPKVLQAAIKSATETVSSFRGTVDYDAESQTWEQITPVSDSSSENDV